MKRDFLTASNLLSLSRAILVIPFAYVMLVPAEPQRVWGGAIIFVAMLTDKFDGVLARRLQQETEWGRILDPLADKIAVAAVAIVLLLLGDIPPWFVAALLLRDAMIVAGGLYVRAKTGVVLPSNHAGKWAVGIVGVTLLIAQLEVFPAGMPYFLAVSLTALLVSLTLYAARFVATVRQRD
jgi:CDP-diacylglycerol--glycerol-3-phosphate 3-phosphatidyltransferase